MRVLLVNPPIPPRNRIRDFAPDGGKNLLTREMSGPPYMLNELAGALRDREARIVDLKAELDAAPASDLGALLEKELADFGPDVVGITCITPQVNSVKRMVKAIKATRPEAFVVVGGLHPTLCPEHFLGTEIDALVLGPGSTTLRLILDALERSRKEPGLDRIPGVAQVRGSELKVSRLLTSLSREELVAGHCDTKILPNRELTDRYDYRIQHTDERVQYVSTSLGCTHRCNFCGLWRLTGGHYIPRDIDCILEQLRGMDRYPVVRMVDAHTFGDPRFAHELFTRIMAEGIRHSYVVDTRADTVVKNPSVFRLARDAGLRVAIIGLEAVTDEELRRYGKGADAFAVERAIDTLNELGVWISGNFIVGCDYSERDFDRLEEFVASHPIFFAGFTVITPFPGTEQYAHWKDRIRIHDFDYYNLQNAVMDTKLPEERFYGRINRLYQISAKARGTFLRKHSGLERASAPEVEHV